MRLLEFSNTTIIPKSSQYSDLKNITVEILTPLVNQINDNCGDCLEAMHVSQCTAWRGFRNQFDLAFSAESVENRRVKDSDPILTAKVDSILQKNGIEARRSNSIFVTSKQGLASVYGRVYAIFPYDYAEFSWSSNEKFDDVVLNPRDSGMSRWLINQLKNYEVFRNIFNNVHNNPDYHGH